MASFSEFKSNMTDERIERLAEAELLKESRAARIRAEVGGSLEWKKKPKKINKIFLVNTILQVTSRNSRKKEEMKN